MVADRLVGRLFHCLSVEKRMVKGWVVCPCMTKTLGSPSSGVTPLEVLVYDDVNMTGVDFVKET